MAYHSIQKVSMNKNFGKWDHKEPVMLVFFQVVITVVNTVQPLFMMEITIIAVMLRRKPRLRPAYAHTTGTGSVTGSQYGGGTNQYN